MRTTPSNVPPRTSRTSRADCPKHPSVLLTRPFLPRVHRWFSTGRPRGLLPHPNRRWYSLAPQPIPPSLRRTVSVPSQSTSFTNMSTTSSAVSPNSTRSFSTSSVLNDRLPFNLSQAVFFPTPRTRTTSSMSAPFPVLDLTIFCSAFLSVLSPPFSGLTL